MELPYPTLKNTKMTYDIKKLDKMARSIVMSTKQMPESQPLPKRLKSKLVRAISNDNPQKLSRILESEVISFFANIGTEGSSWNLLHFCAKSNAPKCIDYILKTQYQEFDEEYRKLANSRTIEGYTPIIVSIINRSDKALESFLFFGGIDLHIRDERKMSPYEIALNYKNDYAIELLMNYENLCKKKQYINRQALSAKINLIKKSCYYSILSNLLYCMSFGMYNIDFDQAEADDINSGKCLENLESRFIDYVHIGSKKQLPGYDIDWKTSTDIFGKRIPLFGSYNPFDIIESNFVIKNQLIIFQCLSQQPWILRKQIKVDQSRNNFYNLTLHRQKLAEKVCLDEHFPYIKERKQAMFISDVAELWPMVLQKGLVKLHGGYFALSAVDPQQMLEEITGFPTSQVKLSEFSDSKEILAFLEKMTARNYLLILKGKQNGELCESPGNIDCFSILNFYQKNSENLVLVNCPFISKQWKEKEKLEPLPLKLIKGHYNTHNQMCVWIQQKDISKYFQSIIFSMTFLNYERTELKIKSKHLVFIQFKIEYKREESVVLQLVDQDTGHVYDLKELEIFRNEGEAQVEPLIQEKHMPNTAQIECEAGDYMCCYRLNNSSCEPTNAEKGNKNLLLICWSLDLIQPEFIEQELGIVQWFGHTRNYFGTIQQKCVVETIDGYSLVLLREPKVERVFMQCNTITGDEILQGKYWEEKAGNQKVELIKSKQADVHYCVVKWEVKADSIVFNYA